METRTCKFCKQEKPLTDFKYNNRNRYGKTCFTCKSIGTPLAQHFRLNRMLLKQSKRKCFTCGFIKPLTEFNIEDSRNGSFRYDGNCKVCSIKNTEDYFKRNENKRLVQINKKRCTTCKTVKDLSEFQPYKNKNTTVSNCRDCRIAYKRNLRIQKAAEAGKVLIPRSIKINEDQQTLF